MVKNRLVFTREFIKGMLGICNLISRRDIALLLMAFKIINGLIPIHDIKTEIRLYFSYDFLLLIIQRCRTKLPIVIPLERDLG